MPTVIHCTTTLVNKDRSAISNEGHIGIDRVSLFSFSNRCPISCLRIQALQMLGPNKLIQSDGLVGKQKLQETRKWTCKTKTNIQLLTGALCFMLFGSVVSTSKNPHTLNIFVKLQHCIANLEWAPNILDDISTWCGRPGTEEEKSEVFLGTTRRCTCCVQCQCSRIEHVLQWSTGESTGQYECSAKLHVMSG